MLFYFVYRKGHLSPSHSFVWIPSQSGDKFALGHLPWFLVLSVTVRPIPEAVDQGRDPTCIFGAAFSLCRINRLLSLNLEYHTNV